MPFALTYTGLQVEAGLAIMEELTTQVQCAGSPVQAWYETNGAAALRHAAMLMMPAVERVWSSLPEGQRDMLTWDWEFVPAMVALFKWDMEGGTFGEFPSDEIMRAKAMEMIHHISDRLSRPV